MFRNDCNTVSLTKLYNFIKSAIKVNQLFKKKNKNLHFLELLRTW